MKRFTFVLALLTIVLHGVCFAGPFGFDYGMTKEQVIAKVGKDAVLKDQGYFLRVSEAPKPDSSFEAYLLLISPKKGLLKIIATGKTIDTSVYGTELQVGFKSLRDSMAAEYGAPTHDFDFLQPDSTLGAPSDWTAGLLKKERKLASTWELAPVGHKSAAKKGEHITSIILETKGLRKDAGWVVLTYEFEGFEQFSMSVLKHK
jgi:hypothetical protein